MEYHFMGFEFMDWDIIESIQIIRATLAPLRLTRWQMFKYMVTSIFRDMRTFPMILLALGSFVVLAFLLTWAKGRDPVERIGLPVVGGSKQHKLDFKEAVEEGRRLVS
jgi:hypothetical protein